MILIGWLGSAVIAVVITHLFSRLRTPVLCVCKDNNNERYFLNGSGVTAYDIQIFDPARNARWEFELVGALLPGDRLYFFDLRDEYVIPSSKFGRLYVLYRRSPVVGYRSDRSYRSPICWLQSFWAWIVVGYWRPDVRPTLTFSQRIVYEGLERRRWFRWSLVDKFRHRAEKETPTP